MALKHFLICIFKIQYITILRFVYIFTETQSLVFSRDPPKHKSLLRGY